MKTSNTRGARNNHRPIGQFVTRASRSLLTCPRELYIDILSSYFEPRQSSNRLSIATLVIGHPQNEENKDDKPQYPINDFLGHNHMKAILVRKRYKERPEAF